MRLAAIATAALLHAAPRRVCHTPRLQLFPEDATSEATPAAPSISFSSLVGFWTIYDAQASEDALNELGKGGDVPRSIVSCTMVLRADGQTSRGSDFPGGQWSLKESTDSETGKERKRVSITLFSKLLRQEWRYEGVVVALQQKEAPSADLGEPDTSNVAEWLQNLGPEKDEASAGVTSSPIAEKSNPWQLRVIGSSSRWDVSDASAPVEIGKSSSFSMVQRTVDRRELVPTIKTFSEAVDPEAVELEQQWRRLTDGEDADSLRQAIEDVKEAKVQYGEDGWMEAIKLREGVDYWHKDDGQEGEGEEPDASSEEDQDVE